MSQATESVAGKSQAATKTILLVEDDPNSSSFLVEAIAHETPPYRAIVASDSKAALKLVRHFTPCLFILDYELPGMNGIERYDRLSLNQELAPIRALPITANRQFPQQQIQRRQLIACKKPFALAAFLAAIETLLASP